MHAPLHYEILGRIRSESLCAAFRRGRQCRRKMLLSLRQQVCLKMLPCSRILRDTTKTHLPSCIRVTARNSCRIYGGSSLIPEPLKRCCRTPFSLCGEAQRRIPTARQCDCGCLVLLVGKL